MNVIMSRAPQNHYPHRLPPPLSPTSPLDFTHRILFKELKLLPGYLGRGSYGTVLKGLWRGRTVAVKQFKEREEISSFLIEVEQLSCVKHPNIVTLYGASTPSDTAYLVMEYAEGGSLNHLLHECKQQPYDLRHACSWAMQAAKGVAYLHGLRPKPIMHRDLKPANLLLFSRHRILKICDFGTACAVKTQMTNNTGSASYMAPEVFEGINYSESADVFSWSIIFWEILARRPPYPQHSQPYNILWNVNVLELRPPEFESCGGLNYCPDIIWRLITMCWVKPPEARPTMQQVADQMELIFHWTDSSRVNHLHQNNHLYSHQNSSSRIASANHVSERQSSSDIKSPHGRQFCRLLPPISLQSTKNSCNEASNGDKHQQQQPLPHQQTTSSKLASFNLERNSRHQHHHEHQSNHDLNYQYLERPSALRSYDGPSNSSGANAISECNSKRSLYIHTIALQHRLEQLRRRAEDLESSIKSGSDKGDTECALKEFEELKKHTELRRQELRSSNRAIMSPNVKSPLKVPSTATCASASDNNRGRS